jgi:putative hemolysin
MLFALAAGTLFFFLLRFLIPSYHALTMSAGVQPAPFSVQRFALQALLVLVLVFVNAFFAMAEIALITVRKTRIKQLVEEGNASGRLVERMLSHPTHMMATIQTGETMIAGLAMSFATIVGYPPLLAALRSTGLPIVIHSSSVLALILVTLPVAFLLIVFGQIVPKSLATRYSERLALVAVHPVAWLQVLLTPAIAILTGVSSLVVKPLGGTATFTVPAVNEEELKILVEASEEQGVLEAEETEMINSILNFSDTVVRKVMTPRIDIAATDIECSIEDLVKLINESGHSRIPVYKGSLDDIVGVVLAKDLLFTKAPTDGGGESILSVMRAPYFIPETKKIDTLLAEFQRGKQQMAIVRDEYGMTSGIVTIEDLVEEIVGDIHDEYDVEESPVQVVDGTHSIVDGRMSLVDLNDRMGMHLPDDESDTIGGFVFGLLGHQAEQGESAIWEGYRFSVEATDGRRILKVRISRAAQVKEDDTDEQNPADREVEPAVHS